MHVCGRIQAQNLELFTSPRGINFPRAKYENEHLVAVSAMNYDANPLQITVSCRIK